MPEQSERRPLPTSLQGFADGDESDRQVVAPWAGPVIDEESGLLREPVRGPHLVATSVGWPKPGHEPAAIELNQGILAELYVRPGLLAVTLAVSEKSWNSTRSLSLWQDEEALQGFLFSKPHLAAARRVKELMYDWEGTNWTVQETTELPTFAQSRTRLDAVRQESGRYTSYEEEPI